MADDKKELERKWSLSCVMLFAVTATASGRWLATWRC